MKIALYNLTTTTKTGGIETFNLEMAGALSKRGWEVHLYVGKGPAAPALPTEIEIRAYPYLKRERIPNLGTRFRKFAERLSFGYHAARDLRQGGYDIIYVSKPFDIPVALRAASASGARVAFGSGGTEFFPGYGRLVKRVDFFFAVSEFNASEIERYCGLRPSVLYNGINTDLFRPVTATPAMRTRLGLDDRDMVIASACRLVGWKGVGYAIRAVGSLISKGHKIRYLVMGDGAERANLEGMARRLNISKSVVFLGSVPNGDIPGYYALSHMAVFPSVGVETFGISIAEAMACGIPVVSTRVGGIPEVVGKGAGRLVPPKDHKALAEAMEDLISDHDLRKETGRLGMERVRDMFAWDVVVDKFESYLRKGEK